MMTYKVQCDKFTIMRWLLVFPLLALAACESTKDAVGLSRKTPDEFNVVTQRPLAVPPNFTLEPPGTRQTSSPSASAKSYQAAQAVLGEAQVTANTPGLQALTKELGVNERAPDIRTQLNKDNEGVMTRDPDFLDRLKVWNSQVPPDPSVDAPKEATRIEQRQSSGGKLDGKGVPDSGKKSKAPLAGVFN